jgi:hypothetical protein
MQSFFLLLKISLPQPFPKESTESIFLNWHNELKINLNECKILAVGGGWGTWVPQKKGK